MCKNCNTQTNGAALAPMGTVTGNPNNNVFRSVYRELNQEEKERLEVIKTKAQELYELFAPLTPNNDLRQLALAKTKLEESVMWAVKGITK